MKKVLVLVLLFVFVSVNSLGSPLIFKIKKAVDTEGLVELGSFDATKYKQIRIGVKAFSTNNTQTNGKSNDYNQLIQKRAELSAEIERLQMIYKDKHPLIVEKRYKIAEINEEIENLEKSQNEKLSPTVTIFAVEDKDEILLENLYGTEINRSILIDMPPSKISVKVSGKGIYSLYVWGQ